jgi:hypothetical protein
MKNVNKYQAAVANNLVLIAAAFIGLCVVMLCSAACYNTQESPCDVQCTLSPGENPVCDGTSVAVTVLTTCDDNDDIVTVSPGSVNLGWETSGSGINFWTNTVQLAVGINYLQAYASDCDKESSVVTVACNGGSGNGPTYVVTGNEPSPLCGFKYNVTFLCLPDSRNPYKIYEAHDVVDPYTDPCLGRVLFNSYPGTTASTALGILTIYDQYGTALCPPYSSDCASGFEKLWIVYDPLDSSFVVGGLVEDLGVSQKKYPTTPGLTLTDSAIPYTYTH